MDFVVHLLRRPEGVRAAGTTDGSGTRPADHAATQHQARLGDSSPSNELVRRFTDALWSNGWPGTRRPDVFYDPRSLLVDSDRAVLHAKAVVADDAVAFVTSANLTEKAFDDNIEVGVLSRDRALATSLSKHFRVLIEREMLLALPTA